MPDESGKPVIFLAFANDRDDRVRYLRNLAEEARRLREALAPAERASLCQVVIRQNITLQEILDFFQDARFRNRVVLFHYGGHANGYELLLETLDGHPTRANATGISAFLAQQSGLQLVFLNGCSTQPQVQGLLNAGVPAVIATAQAIDDGVATEFARRFYLGLAGGADLGEAFKEAEAGVRIAHGDSPRDAYLADQAGITVDRWPWELIVRHGAEAVEHWNLPEAAGNQLFGLPSLPEMDLPQNPYRYLDWYHREDAEVFFGRGREIRELYERVTSLQAAPIILFYGQAGVGKSSLLAAGLLPRLEDSHMIRYVRRDQELGLLATLKTALGAESQSDFEVGRIWHEFEAQEKKPLMVILDQVEEVYTRPNPNLPNELAGFFTGLRPILIDASQRPRGRLLLSFRKEWLAEVETQLQLQHLPHSKVPLERLDRRGIVEIVAGPASSKRLCEQYRLKVEDNLPELIADDLLADSGSVVAPVLQILLAKMWERTLQNNPDRPTFERALYDQLRTEGLGLGDFLDGQMKALYATQPQVVDSGLALDLLAYHTTPLGTAEERIRTELDEIYPHRQEVMPNLLQNCQDLYLLVDPAKRNPSQPNSSRLAHDTLAPLVRKRFDESDRPGQRARRVLENRAVDWEVDKVGIPLDESDLQVVERGKSGMRAWKHSEERLVAASRLERSRRRRDKMILQGVGAALLLLILIATGLAVWQWQTALRQARIATSRELAVQAASQIGLDTDLALLLSVEAVRQASTFESQRSLFAGIQFRQTLEATLRGHVANQDGNTEVYSVVWHPDGKLLASGGSDGTVRLWEVEKGLPHGEPLRGHEGAVYSVAFRPDGEVLASAGEDGTVRLWDTITGKALGETLGGHEGQVYSIAWRPDGEMLASAGGDGMVQLWDTMIGRPLGKPLRGHEGAVSSITWRPDGEMLASAGEDGTVRLWTEGKTGWETSRVLETEQGGIISLAWSPDGSELAMGGVDGTVSVWDTTDGSPHCDRMRGHGVDEYSDLMVYRVAWRPNGEILASAGEDGTILLWDVSLFNCRLGTPLNTGQVARPKKIVFSVAWSPDGDVLASAGEDGTVRLWSADTQQVLSEALDGYPAAVYGIAWKNTQWGDTLAAVKADGTLQAWKEFISQPPESQHLHDGSSYSLTWHPGQRGMVASSGIDGTVRLWDGSQLETLRGHQGAVYSVSWRPDGLTLTSAGADGMLRLWAKEDSGGELIWPSVEGWKMDRVIDAGQGEVRCIAWSPDGEVLASAGEDGTVRLWNPIIGKAPSETLRGHEGQVLSVAWNPKKGGILASAGVDGTVRFWNEREASWEPGNILRGHQGAVYSVAWRSDGTVLASAGEDGTVRLWDAVTGMPLGEPLRGHTADAWGKIAVYSVAWRADGAVLASGGADGTVREWDTTYWWGVTTQLNTFDNPLNSVAWRPRGQALAMTGDAGVVWIWDLDTGQPILEPLHIRQNGVRSVSWRSDGQALATVGKYGMVQLWDITGQPIGESLEGSYYIEEVAWQPPDGQVLAMIDNSTVLLYDMHRHSLLDEPLDAGQGFLYGLAWRPDGKVLTTWGESQTVQLWDSSGRKLGEAWKSSRPGGSANFVAWRPDGKVLAISFGLGVGLWDADQWKPLGELVGWSTRVDNIAWNPDGTLLATLSSNRGVLLWDAASRQMLSGVLNTEKVNDIAWRPDGKILALAGENGRVMLWDVDAESWQAHACRIAGRNLSDTEWKIYFPDETHYRCSCPNLPPGEEVLKTTCE